MEKGEVPMEEKKTLYKNTQKTYVKNRVFLFLF